MFTEKYPCKDQYRSVSVQTEKIQLLAAWGFPHNLAALDPDISNSQTYPSCKKRVFSCLKRVFSCLE